MNTPTHQNNFSQNNSSSLAQTESNNYPPAEVRHEYASPVTVSSSGRYVVEEGGGMDLAHIFSSLRRRWKVMVSVFLAVLLLSIYLSRKELPVYESMAIMEISTADSTSNALENVPGLENFVNRQSERGSLATQLALLRSSEIRRAATARLSAEDQKKFSQIVSFDASLLEDTNLLAVKVQSLNPQLAANFANALCAAYIDTSLQNNRRRSNGAISYVEEQLRLIRGKLQTAQGELTTYKKRTGIFSVDSQANALGVKLSSVQNSLDEAQAEKSSTEASLREARKILAGIPAGNVVASGLTDNAQAITLRGRLGELEINRSAALQEYTPTSFRVQSIDAEIRAVKKSLAAMPSKTVNNYIEDPRRAPLEQQIAGSQAALEALSARIATFQNQLVDAQSAYKELPDQEYRFLLLSAQVESLLRTRNLLNEKLGTLSLTANAKVADGIMQSTATASSNPLNTNAKRKILSSLAFAIIAALGVALLWDTLDNRIYSDEDAQRATGLPVLAQIPHEKSPDAQLVLNSSQKMSPILESFRMLRANIAFSGADRPIRSIVVTSSLPNEGKSTTALNLATTAALGGESVILLDLDLRRPTQHALIGINNTPGFVNVILGNHTLEEVIQETPVEGLRVVTCGSIPPNPFKILNSDAARQLIYRLMEMADFVVIDTPPLLGLADARLIASIVDGTIMVISCDETKRREASRAADLLHGSNGEIIGSVFTKVPHSSAGYSDYYTYRSYGQALEEGKEDSGKKSA